MNKKAIHVLIFCLIIIGGFAFYQFRSVAAQEVAMASSVNSRISDTPNPDEATVLEAIETSEELTAKWLESIGSGEWLFVSSKYETTQDTGIDPETGLPLPKKSLWESWYELDSNGRQTTVLTRRTDLESGNVTYVAWQNGQLLRLPSGEREQTNQRGGGWESFRPLIDHYCNTRLPYFLEKPDEGNSKNVVIQSDGAESDQWIVTMSYGHPPVSEVTGYSGTFVGAELTCFRNTETGAIENAEEYLITEGGERVLLGHDYDYVVMWVEAPPTEMLDLIDQLNAN